MACRAGYQQGTCTLAVRRLMVEEHMCPVGYPPGYPYTEAPEPKFTSRGPMFWVVWRLGGDPPTKAHPSAIDARREAARLAKTNPGEVFIVFQADS